MTPYYHFNCIALCHPADWVNNLHQYQSYQFTGKNRQCWRWCK